MTSHQQEERNKQTNNPSILDFGLQLCASAAAAAYSPYRSLCTCSTYRPVSGHRLSTTGPSHRQCKIDGSALVASAKRGEPKTGELLSGRHRKFDIALRPWGRNLSRVTMRDVTVDCNETIFVCFLRYWPGLVKPSGCAQGELETWIRGFLRVRAGRKGTLAMMLWLMTCICRPSPRFGIRRKRDEPHSDCWGFLYLRIHFAEAGEEWMPR